MTIIKQMAMEIDSPMESKNKAAKAINAEIRAGWRVAHVVHVGALSTVNAQPITSSILVIFEREE